MNQEEHIPVTILYLKLQCQGILCDYADAYIHVKGTITITGTGDDDAAKQLDEKNKSVIFKNCFIY